jgi:hypothetical protein
MLEGREFLEKLRFGIDAELVQAGGGDLEMKRPSVRRLAFDEQCRALEALNDRGWQIGRDRRSRYADRKVGTQVSDQVFPHPIGGTPRKRLLERGARDARRLHRAESNDDRALPTVARGREHDVDRAAVLPDAHAGHSHPIVGLRLGDELLHMTVRDDHDALTRVRGWPDAVSLVARKPRCTRHSRHGTEFVGGKEAGEGRRLDRERCFELEEVAERGQRGGPLRAD